MNVLDEDEELDFYLQNMRDTDNNNDDFINNIIYSNDKDKIKNTILGLYYSQLSQKKYIEYKLKLIKALNPFYTNDVLASAPNSIIFEEMVFNRITNWKPVSKSDYKKILNEACIHFNVPIVKFLINSGIRTGNEIVNIIKFYDKKKDREAKQLIKFLVNEKNIKYKLSEDDIDDIFDGIEEEDVIDIYNFFHFLSTRFKNFISKHVQKQIHREYSHILKERLPIKIKDDLFLEYLEY